MAQAKRDQNNVPTLLGVSNADGSTPVTVYADPVTHRILVDLPSSGGTVSSVSVVSANGFAGTVATATTTPAITLSTTITGILSGNGTAISAASTTGSGSVVLATSPTLVTPLLGTPTSGNLVNCTGYTVANVAGLGTGVGTWLATPSSANLASAVTDETGSGSLVFGTSPTITTSNLSGAQQLAENASIALDPAGSADGKYTGITVTATAGYTQAFGDLVYIDPTDSRWEACDANSAAGADGDSRGIIGMVVVAGTDGTACTVLLNGIIRADAKFPTFTVNNPIYVSETAGLVTQTQPSTADVVIRVVGFALTADEMYFNPSSDYITHT